MNQDRESHRGQGEEEYSPRPHDHIVEPVFGGLGVEPNGESGADSAGENAGAEDAERGSGGGCLALILVTGVLAWFSR